MEPFSIETDIAALCHCLKRHAPRKSKNLRFYLGSYKTRLEGQTIDNVHRIWFNRYDQIEKHPVFIRWLFPTLPPLVTGDATSFELDGSIPLHHHEAEEISKNIACSIRVVHSYRLMLNFLGIQLVDDKTGALQRHPEIWKARYSALNISPPTHEKITRMLKSLSTLGFFLYVEPFVKFLSNEIHTYRILPNCRIPLQDDWEKLVAPAEPPERVSVFFEHAERNSKEYQQFKRDIERSKYWLLTPHVRGKDEEKIIDEFKEALQIANKDQVERQDESLMSQKNQAAQSLTVNPSATSFFKGHYNTREEEERATEEFLKEIEKGRQQVNADRQRAAQNLENLMASRREASS